MQPRWRCHTTKEPHIASSKLLIQLQPCYKTIRHNKKKPSGLQPDGLKVLIENHVNDYQLKTNEIYEIFLTSKRPKQKKVSKRKAAYNIQLNIPLIGIIMKMTITYY